MDERTKEIIYDAVEVWCQNFDDYVSPNILDIQSKLYDIASDLYDISDDELLSLRKSYEDGELEEAAEYCLREYKTACKEYEEFIKEREREYRDMVWGNQVCPQ
ncbi:hypothetical protein [Methanobrevibacter sp.]|uniref:hypothetical protein n=1 Tax=Methanobrevibacter sp. TaxID=66852 RepID=UPI00388DA7B2